MDLNIVVVGIVNIYLHGYKMKKHKRTFKTTISWTKRHFKTYMSPGNYCSYCWASRAYYRTSSWTEGYKLIKGKYV